MGRVLVTEYGEHEMAGMDALAASVAEDYVGTCEVLESGPDLARLCLWPEAGGPREGSPPVTFEVAPFVLVSRAPAEDGVVVESPVDLVLVTPCGGSWDAVPVLVSPVASAVIAVALR